MMANTGNQTRTCPHCGAKSSLFHLRIITRVKSSQEATAIIQKLKENNADPDWEPHFKRFKVNTEK